MSESEAGYGGDSRDVMPVRAGVEHILRFFRYAHLPPHLQDVSRPFGDLAERVASASSSPEVLVALRKLLEAKDAAVRAVL